MCIFLSLCPEPSASQMPAYLLLGSCEDEEEWWKNPMLQKSKLVRKLLCFSFPQDLGNGLAIWISVIICQVSGTDTKHRTECKKDRQQSWTMLSTTIGKSTLVFGKSSRKLGTRAWGKRFAFWNVWTENLLPPSVSRYLFPRTSPWSSVCMGPGPCP